MSAQIQLELDWILKKHIRDPILQQVTFTQVTLSKDFQYADIGFTHLAKDIHAINMTSVGKNLRHLSKFFRFLIAQRMNWRKVPTIRFFSDEQI